MQKGKRFWCPSGLTSVLLALMLLYIPFEWLGAFLLAALVHEGGHLLAVKLCGGVVPTLRIGTGGAVMNASSLDGWRLPLCLLAGPLGGCALLLVARWFPRAALCALVQSIYNFLPIRHLDGGRMLRWMAERWMKSDCAERLCAGVEKITYTVLCVFLLVLGVIFKAGIMGAVLGMVLFFRIMLGNRL